MRFGGGAKSAQLQSTFSGQSNTYTISFWAKSTSAETNKFIFSQASTAEINNVPGDPIGIGTNSGQYRYYSSADSVNIGDSTTLEWVNIVASNNNGTVSFYYNGTLSPNTTAAPALLDQSLCEIGSRTDQAGSTFYYSGYVSELYFVDGQALPASTFATTNSDTQTWVPLPPVNTKANIDAGFASEFPSGATITGVTGPKPVGANNANSGSESGKGWPEILGKTLTNGYNQNTMPWVWIPNGVTVTFDYVGTDPIFVACSNNLSTASSVSIGDSSDVQEAGTSLTSGTGTINDGSGVGGGFTVTPTKSSGSFSFACGATLYIFGINPGTPPQYNTSQVWSDLIQGDVNTSSGSPGTLFDGVYRT